MNNEIVENFREKPDGENSWINGGFFIVEPEALNYISSDDSSWEVDVLPVIANKGQLRAFLHNDFWQPMDTLRDKERLEKLCQKVIHHGNFGN